MRTPDFASLDRFMEQYHLALDQFHRGDPRPAQALFSHENDVTLANPFGPVVAGWNQVASTMERAASNYREGASTGFETIARKVTPDLAYIVEIERFRAKVGGRTEVASGALRVTTILRPEQGNWKIVHRHADPITSARPADSVIKE